MSIHAINDARNLRADAAAREAAMRFRQGMIAHFDQIILDNALPYPDGHGYTLSLDDISSQDRKMLTALMMRESEFIGEDLEALYENANLNKIKDALYRMLERVGPDTEKVFTETLQSQLFEYYRTRLQTLLDARLEVINEEERRGCGYVEVMDNETGEITWRKA